MKSFKEFRLHFAQLLPALQSPGFRNFLGGQSLSLLGTWMQRTALVWLVYVTTDSPFLVGLVGVFQFLPSLLLSLFAGVLIDRRSKRKLLLCTQTILTLQALLLGTLSLLGVVQYWHICVLSFVFGLANSVDMPARQALVIELVGRETLQNAVALNSTVFNFARIVGPVLAGLAMEAWGAEVCFFLNALSFLPAIVGIARIRLPPAVQRPQREKSVWAAISAGLRHIGERPKLAQTMLLMISVCTFAMNNEVMVPALVRQVLHASGRAYSWLVSAMGVGALVAALTLVAQARRPPGRRIQLLVAFAIAVDLCLLALPRHFAFAFVLLVVSGFLNVVFLNFANTTLQLNSDDSLRGRVMSIYALITLGSTPFGNLIAGTLTERFGASFGFLGCGLLTLATAFLAFAVHGARESGCSRE